MVEHIENGVKKATKTIIQNAKFVSLISDEIISMDSALGKSAWLYSPRLVSHILVVECETCVF